MKRLFVVLAASALSGSLAFAADSPKEDLKFLGIDKCKKEKFDCAWVDPGFTFNGKTIHVQKFEKVAEAPKGDDYGDLHWKNADTFMQEVFADKTNDGVEKICKFVTGGS